MPFPVKIPSSWACFPVFRLIFAAFHVLSVGIAGAQEYSYIQYDAKDGLAGTVVYSMCQDKEGFIWFGTETGVSRFDGTHFKNFTVKDGLPDNTIIRVYADSKGRVWLMPFKHAICYYYKGKIYSQQNDPLLKNIKLDHFVTSFCEDKAQNIVLKAASSVWLITPGDKVFPLTFERPVLKISHSETGHFWVFMGDSLYAFDTKKNTFYSRMQRRLVVGGVEQLIMHDKLVCGMVSPGKLHVQSLYYNLDYIYPTPPVSTISLVNDSVICLNTTQGAIFLNILARKPENHFLINKHVSSMLIDKEGGIWFSTFNDGVFRLNSKEFKNIRKEIKGGQKLSVYDLKQYKGTIFAGCDMGYIQVIRNDAAELISLSQVLNIPLSSPVASIGKRGNLLAFGSGNYIFLKRAFSGIHCTDSASSVKEIVFKNDSTLIIAGGQYLHEVPLSVGDSVHTLWRGRTTCVLLRDSLIYFGTLNGLYQLNSDKTVLYLGDIYPVLQNRIASIREGAGGTIWVATYGEGIIGLKNNRIIRQITQTDGLSSNICRCLAVDSSCIWVGTDKGLNRVDLSVNPAGITKYTAADGLAADIINTVLITGDTVYAGTPAGVTYFNKTKVAAISHCDLKILNVHVNGREVDYENSFNLHHADNNIRFDYAGISFKSVGDIVYTYRLNGWDTTWKTTTQTSLEFISLPPGKYMLELFATNRFGVKSGLLATGIMVQTPFWQTIWFVVLCTGVIAFLTWLIVSSRNKRSQKKATAARAFEQRLQELEQKALRAQMNPHFIFNSLNSVQEFILDSDILNANKYLSNFARLIRQTLENSLHPFITIADEVRYLTTYLNLEEMRFKQKFSHIIQIDESIAAYDTFIPGMLLQPYVENAIHHGVQHKAGKEQGQVAITISQVKSMIFCTILDNGVGRKAAQEFRAVGTVAHESRGMQLTQERIDMLNKTLNPKIMVEVIDCTDADGEARGTKVIIRLPLIQNKE